MTNILILSISLATTNVTPYGARDTTGWWCPCISWNVSMKYVVPPATTNVTYLEYTHDADGSHPFRDGSGTWGMGWTPLNILTSGSNFYNGFYTNINPSINRNQTNTIVFPVPPWDRMFFRMMKVNP